MNPDSRPCSCDVADTGDYCDYDEQGFYCDCDVDCEPLWACACDKTIYCDANCGCDSGCPMEQPEACGVEGKIRDVPCGAEDQGSRLQTCTANGWSDDLQGCVSVDPCRFTQDNGQTFGEIVCDQLPRSYCDDRSVVSFSGGACDSGTCAYTETITPCGEGRHCINAACEEGAPLEVVFVTPSENFYSRGAVDIKIGFSNSELVPRKVELLANGEFVSEFTAGNQLAWDASGFAEGAYELRVRATYDHGPVISAPLMMNLDRTPPTLKSMVPAMPEGMTADGSIWLHFSEPVRLPSGREVTDELLRRSSDSGAIVVEYALHDGGRTVSITPRTPLRGGINIYLDGLLTSDLAGNSLASLQQEFYVQAWGTVGPPLVSGYEFAAQVRTGANDEILVGWLNTDSERLVNQEGFASYVVSKLGEGKWQKVVELDGIEVSALSTFSALQLRLDSNFDPAIFYEAEEGLLLKRWINSQWLDYPGIPVHGSYTSHTLAFDWDGHPVVAFKENGDCAELRVHRWTGQSWASLPNPTPNACVLGEITMTTGGDGGIAILLQTATGVWAYEWASDPILPEWVPIGLSTVHPTVARHAAHPDQSSSLLMTAPDLSWGNDDVIRAIWGNQGKITAFEFENARWTPIGIGELNMRQNEAQAVPRTLGINKSGQGHAFFTDLNPIGGFASESTGNFLRFKTGEEWRFAPALGAGSYLDGHITPSGDVLAAVLNPKRSLVIKRFSPLVSLKYAPAPAFGDSGCGPFDGDPDDANSAFPKTLGATGCYSDLGTQTPADGAIPLAPNAALWTDGAVKRRYVYLPTPDSQIEYRDYDSWVFPVGTILIKDFAVYSDMSDINSPLIPVETRVLVRVDAASWDAYSYQWNDDGTDAFLRDNEDGTVEWDVSNNPYSSDGQSTLFTHFYPSRDNCFQCHDNDPERTPLGPKTGQMRSWHWQGDRSENQIEYMNRHNLISGFPEDPASLPDAIPSPYNSAQPVETRSRSYLHANCAHCHHEDESYLCGDHEIQTAISDESWLGDSGLCDQIQAGDPASSTIYTRTGQVDFGMPPLGRLRIDPQLTELLHTWISEMQVCE